MVQNNYAQVIVTSAGTQNLCIGEDFSLISDIVIAETVSGDFADASLTPRTYIIAAPTNFQFDSNFGSVSSTGDDISFTDIVVQSNQIRVIYVDDGNDITLLESLTISDIRVRAINSATGPVNLVRTGGDANHIGNAPVNAQIHAIFESFTPPNAGNATNTTICTTETAFDLNTILAGNDAGTWTETTTTLSGEFSAPSTFNASNAGPGTYEFTYTVSGANCLDDTEVVEITVVTTPNPGTATNTSVCANSGLFNLFTTLTGNDSGGTWIDDDLTGALSGNSLNINSLTAGNSYDFTYSLNNGACTESSTVTITVDAQPTTADAGTDIDQCAIGSFTLDGNTPTTGTGLWTVVNGTASITSPTVATSGVTGVPVGSAATLRWTISNGSCSDSFDEVVLNNFATPSAADAGENITQCNNATFVMAAVNPTTGTGAWSVVSGTASITNTTSNTTTVTGITAGASAVVRWTVSNGPSCTPTFENITLTNNALPTTADAGTDIEQCATGSFTLDGNNPTTGTGLWTVVNGTASITSPTVATSGVTGVPVGSAATLRWTISNGSCSDSFDEVVLNNFATPSAADAGTNITQCNNATFVMAAVNPTTGTGAWSVVSGTASITNTTSNTTTVTGITAGASAVVRWTVSNGAACTPTFEDITLTNSALPTTADAGTDIEQCAIGSFTLDGNTPTTGTGLWTVVNGTASITSPTVATSGVTGVPVGSAATLRWTISNGSCSDSFDEVVLNNFAAPSAADAGTNITQCNNATFVMAAVNPTTGTGAWSVVSGTASITNTTSNTTTVTGITAGASAVVRWTVSNGPACTPTFEDITLTNSALPTTADAGTDIEQCANGSFTLDGNTPTTGTGLWTVVNGTASITSPTVATSGVTGVPVGTAATLRWTISNGSCSDSFDEVVLNNFTAPSAADAGTNITQCNNATFVMAAVNPTTGTGAWSVVSGAASITNTTSNTTTVTGITAGTSAVVRWTVSNGAACTPTFEDITLTNSALPTTANAGTDIDQCAIGSFTLDGNTPTTGTGLWTVVNGTASITSPTVATSGVTGVPVGTAATLRWTISNGSCSDSFDEVVLNNFTAPSAADAGTNITQCNNATFVMAAVNPTTGTGAWSVVSGAASITNTTSNTTTVTGITAGTSAVVRWTVSNGAACTPTFEDITLTNSALPTTANAGTDIDQCAIGSFTLDGNTPTTGTGLWTVVNGTASITSPTVATSGVTGVPVGTAATLRWTISNGSCSDSFDEVVLNNFTAPSAADAGTNITQCNNATFVMAAVNPTTGTGAWSVVSGAASITNTTSNTTTVTGITAGTSAVVRWTVSNGAACTPTFEDITLTNSALPTTANAGTDIDQCAIGSFTLDGNTPTTGTGLWTVVNGTASITSPTVATSGVTGVPVGTAATLRWTISNGSCSDSFDEVVLNNFTAPSAADAGTNITQCNNATFVMAAVNPTTGTGAWSVVSGAASITNTTSNTTTVTGITAGTSAVVRWTVSNGAACTPTFEDITLTNSALPTTANAGTDIEQCAIGSFTLDGNTPTTGTGLWTVVNGTASITSPTVATSGVTGVPVGTAATLRWTISNGSCSDSFDEVVLNNFAAPVFAPVPNNVEACAGELININFTTASGTDNISWTADNNLTGNPSSGGNNITFLTIPNNTESAFVTTITVSAINATCTTPVTTSFTITVKPTPDINNFFPPAEVCNNETAVDLTSLGLTSNISGGEFTFAGPGVNSAAKTFDASGFLGVQEIEVTYTLNGCSKTEQINLLNVIAQPTADAGAAADVVCVNTPYTVTDASVTNSAGILWTEDGFGILTNATTLTPTYTPHPDDAGQIVTLTLTVDGVSTCGDATDTKVLTIDERPEYTITTTITEICETQTLDLIATIAGGATGGTWTITGGGTIGSIGTTTDNSGNWTATFSPSGTAFGTVTAQFEASTSNTCASEFETFTFDVFENPTAVIPTNFNTCGDAAFDLDATLGGSAVNGSWTVITNGNSANLSASSTAAGITSATYTPDAADYNSTITFQFEAFDPETTGPCGDNTYTLDITIDEPAGVAITTAPANVCQTQTIALSGDFSGSATSASWSENGNGSLTNIITTGNTVTADYTPTAADIGNTVTFTLTTNNPANTCNSVSQSVDFVIDAPAQATVITTTNEICETQTLDLIATIAGGATGGNWTIIGGGTIGSIGTTTDNSGNWTATFSPSGTDYGTVTAQFEATTSNTCASEFETFTFDVFENPTAVIPTNFNTCGDAAFDLDATLGGSAVNGSWTVITNGNSANLSASSTAAGITSATYTPDAADYATVITFQFTALDPAAGPCGDNTYTVAVTIDEPTTSNILTTSTEVCEADPFTLRGTIAGGATSAQWRLKAGQPAGAETSGAITTTNNNSGIWEAIFTPNGSYFGNVIFEFVASTSNTCSEVIREHTLNIRNIPVVANQTYEYCEDAFGSGVSNRDLTTYNTDVTSEPQTNVTIEWYTNSTLTNLVANETSEDVSNNSIYYAKITFLATTCFNIAEVTFNVNPLPTVTALNKAYCENNLGDGEATIDLTSLQPEVNNQTGNFTFEWFTSADLNPANQIAAGDLLTYTIVGVDILYVNVVNDDTGCENNTTVDFVVLPLPNLTTPDDIIVCSFDNINTNFTTNLTGVTYSWTNDNTATGIAASGTGNINVTATENLTGVNEISNITVFATKDGCPSNVENFQVIIKPKPIIIAQATIQICPQDEVSSIILNDNSGGASTISWTATNAGSVGLPAGSGTGDIPAFTARNNNTTADIVSTVTVTSSWDGCISDQQNFEIRLKPRPIMNAVANSELCAGDTYTVNFSNSLGAGTSYSWTNDNVSTGLAASGNGNVISFTANDNNTGTAITSNIIVTPLNNGCVGPQETFTITLNPTPVFTPLQDQEYCSEEVVSIPISTNLTDVIFSLSVSNSAIFASGPVLNGENIEFILDINITGTDETSVITVNAEKDGCFSSEVFEITLKNKPVVTPEADEIELCASDNVSPRVFSHLSGSGDFSWEITNIELIGDGTAANGTGNFPGFELAENLTGIEKVGYVKYFSESNGCFSEEDSFKITLKPSPLMLNEDVVFCPGDFVNVEFLTNIASGTRYYWTNNNTTIGINNVNGETDSTITPNGFTATNASRTEDNIANISVYGINDGCQGPSKTFRIIVKPNPIIEIRYENTCDIDNGVRLDFTSSYDNLESDSIISYVWTVPTDPSITVENDTVIFNSSGRKDIRLEVETALGCVFITDYAIEVWNVDSIDFNFSNVSTSLPGNPNGTTFDPVVSPEFGPGIVNYTYQWNFGDPTSGADNISTEENPVHNYGAPGAYTVNLIITASGAAQEDLGSCSKMISKTINIVESVNSFPYFVDFEDNNANWFTESEVNGTSWSYIDQRNLPGNAADSLFFINEKNDSKVWGTLLNGESAGYNDDEYSYLNTSIFDLTQLDKPMLAFDMWLDVNNINRAGAIIEYSTDGIIYQILGAIDEPLNWYNISGSRDIGGDNNPDQYAWYYSENEDWEWNRVAFPLDDLINNNSVYLRIAFRGSSNDQSKGIAIDNFYIGERTKNVLVENFTNMNATDFDDSQSILNQYLNDPFLSKDIVNLQFHNTYPRPDVLSMRNNLELDARAAVYAINSSSVYVFDGQRMSDVLFSEEYQNEIRARSLIDAVAAEPKTNIEIIVDSLVDQYTVKFDANITIDTAIANNQQLAVYYFVVQKSVNSIEGTSRTLENVVIKTLPNINGHILSGGSTINDTYEWKVKNILNEDLLAIVTVIQDLNTNEVIQTTITDIQDPKLEGMINSVDDLLDLGKINIYPNPSRDKFIIELPLYNQSEITYTVLDNVGKIIKTHTIKVGEQKHDLHLRGLSTGIYHVLFKDDAGNISKKKIVLID